MWGLETANEPERGRVPELKARYVWRRWGGAVNSISCMGVVV